MLLAICVRYEQQVLGICILKLSISILSIYSLAVEKIINLFLYFEWIVFQIH